MKKTKRPTRTLFDIIKSKDINELITVEANSPVMEALMIMAKFKIGALIVMHKDKMAGIISERDYAREMILEGRSSRDTLVKEIMTKNPISIDKDVLAAKALSVMNSKKITSLCIHDKKNKFKTIGIVHIHNILQSNIA